MTFSWDLPVAEKLAEEWKSAGPVKMGGPATGQRSGDFTPGLYLKRGYVITSRGCPNRCWFCSVWKREGDGVRELPIQDGHNVQDDNLLACSDSHVRKVFAMLRRQECAVQLSGGLEAARLQDWHVDELLTLSLQYAYFAYDTPNDLEPLREAAKKLRDAGLIHSGKTICRCYVLAGYPKDSYGAADRRMYEVLSLGFIPFVMLFRDELGRVKDGWRIFRKRWHLVPSIIRGIRDDLLSKGS